MIPLLIGWFAEKAWPIVAALAALALLAGCVLLLELHGAGRGRAEVRAEWDAAKDRQRAVDATYRARLEADYREISDGARDQLARVRTDAAAAGRAGERLRDVYAAAVARGCPADPAGGAAAAGASHLLADVQRRLGEAAGELAAVADYRGAAGAACERALTAASTASPTPMSAQVVGSGAGETEPTSPSITSQAGR
jgi:hypothetical protein